MKRIAKPWRLKKRERANRRVAAMTSAAFLATVLPARAQSPTPAEAPPDASKPIVLDPLTVEAERSRYQADKPAYEKATEPLVDTPQSITVVPQEVIRDQGATTLRDTLRNVAGIAIAAGEGGNQGDNVTVRGFPARGDIFLDGMRDFGSYYRDPFNLEAVEVLKGPASVFFGRGSTGGVVNQASKRPSLEPSIGGSLVAGTDQTKRATADVNQPITKIGHGTAFRLNAMGNDSELAGRDIGNYRRFGFAPSLAVGLGTPTQFTMSYLHQSEDDTPDYGIPFFFDRPADVARDNYYGFKDDNFLRTTADVATARFDHKFNDAVSVRNQFRYATYDRNFRITESRLPTPPPAAPTPAPGAPAPAPTPPPAAAAPTPLIPTPDTPLGEISVIRNQIAGDSTETFLQNQTDVTARFETGFVQHTAIAGVEAGRETSDPTRFTFSGVPTTSLVNPNEHELFAGTSKVNTDVETTATSVALYGVDTLKLGEHWELTGGVRWDRFDAEFDQFVEPATSFDRVDDEVTYRGALVFKPMQSGSVYFSYGTSFNPSAENLSLAANNANLPPEKNETFEVGSKWNVFDELLSVRGALFRTRKKNARETDPNNAQLQILSGEQRVNGFEIEAIGQPIENLQLLSGYAYLDGEIIDSAIAGAKGRTIANTPKHTLSFWSTYELPYSIGVGAGVRYVSSRVASTTPEPVTGRLREVPGYWTVDAMARYQVTDNIGVQVNVYNLADKYYIDQIHPGHLIPGVARSALFSTQFRF